MRTSTGNEVDFVLYGARGFHAVEVKRSARVRAEDMRGLQQFREDYPEASAWLFYGGTKRFHQSGVNVVPVANALCELDRILAS